MDAIIGIIKAITAELLVKAESAPAMRVTTIMKTLSLLTTLVLLSTSPSFDATPVSNNELPTIIIPTTIIATFDEKPAYASLGGIIPKIAIANDANIAVATKGILSNAKDIIANEIIIIAIVLCSIIISF
jgi:hypothetical protein